MTGRHSDPMQAVDAHAHWEMTLAETRRQQRELIAADLRERVHGIMTDFLGHELYLVPELEYWIDRLEGRS